MQPDQKKALVSEFFRMGGKRAGFESSYKQTMAVQRKSSGGAWSGYVNIGTLMDFWKVCLTLLVVWVGRDRLLWFLLFFCGNAISFHMIPIIDK